MSRIYAILELVPFIFIFYYHIRYQLLNLLKIKSDIIQQDLKFVDLQLVKSE